MSAKHTPGPWIPAKYGDYGDYNGKCRVILGEGGDIRVAVVLGFNSEENQANTSLIAAAPDLFAALKALVHSLDEDDMKHDDQRKAFSASFKAIAKATGKAP